MTADERGRVERLEAQVQALVDLVHRQREMLMDAEERLAYFQATVGWVAPRSMMR